MAIDSSYLILYGKEFSWEPYKNTFLLAAINENNEPYELVGTGTGLLLWRNRDLGGAAIASQNLVSNGYIKYASGLIMQWGMTILYIDIPNTIVFPISFSSENICINLTSKKYDSSDTTFHRSSFVDIIEDNCFMAYPTQNGCFMWFAIGY